MSRRVRYVPYFERSCTSVSMRTTMSAVG
jgi:hypothetical protein